MSVREIEDRWIVVDDDGHIWDLGDRFPNIREANFKASKKKEDEKSE